VACVIEKLDILDTRPDTLIAKINEIIDWANEYVENRQLVLGSVEQQKAGVPDEPKPHGDIEKPEPSDATP
jgi:hypothetical protein